MLRIRSGDGCAETRRAAVVRVRSSRREYVARPRSSADQSGSVSSASPPAAAASVLNSIAASTFVIILDRSWLPPEVKKSLTTNGTST